VKLHMPQRGGEAERWLGKSTLAFICSGAAAEIVPRLPELTYQSSIDGESWGQAAALARRVPLTLGHCLCACDGHGAQPIWPRMVLQAQNLRNQIQPDAPKHKLDRRECNGGFKRNAALVSR
jgi:hypothetical protein